MIYFTSDQHYYHTNVITHCGRPFLDRDQMNHILIANHNARVKPEDTVYHLGDFSFGSKEMSKGILSSLNGKHILVIGNHDRSVTAMKEIGFNEIHDNLQLEINGCKVYCAHIPYREDQREGRVYKAHLTKPPPPFYHYFLCGHVHEKWARRGKIINVGVDVRNFSPATFDELIATPHAIDKGDGIDSTKESATQGVPFVQQ